jgi:hypothetical protein
MVSLPPEVVQSETLARLKSPDVIVSFNAQDSQGAPRRLEKLLPPARSSPALGDFNRLDDVWGVRVAVGEPLQIAVSILSKVGFRKDSWFVHFGWADRRLTDKPVVQIGAKYRIYRALHRLQQF